MRIEPRLADNFGRSFSYLRLSLTDICNFRCSYCLPNGYRKTGRADYLNYEEIMRLAAVFAGLGIKKIRLTGGEPTLRPDFLKIAAGLAALPGIERLALTTNGYRLAERAGDYFAAGLRAVNISMDSLNAAQFRQITGHDRLSEILRGIEECLRLGFPAVKINTVLLKGINESELDEFIAFVTDRPISLRFIELMQTGENQAYFAARHLPGSYISEPLLRRGWQIKPRAETAGPAVEFAHAESRGTIGLIAPYAKDFCAGCNRLRVSAKGDLHLCLFGEGGHSLRPWLADSAEILEEKILALLRFKQSGHFLHQGATGATKNLSSIGG